MILTGEERTKFAAYLRQRIHDNELMAEQLKKIPAGEIIARAEAIETIAMKVVAKFLDSIHDERIDAK